MVISNFQYRNLFRSTDYRDSAALYRRVAPGLLLSGHWSPRIFDEPLAEAMDYMGERIVELHRALLPDSELGLAVDGVQARIAPYRSSMDAGSRRSFSVELVNPLTEPALTRVEPVLPVGWRSIPVRYEQQLAPGARVEVDFQLTAASTPEPRQRIAVDVSFGALHLGQHAEAIVDVL
jgi:hypothetical protein